jgi:high-affinity iron transporter
MLGQYLITFREVLEAALITSIVLAYMARTGKGDLGRYIWWGVTLAVAGSVATGLLVASVYGGLSESSEKLFEGAAALLAVVVLTSMILWMALKGGMMKDEVKEKVRKAVERGTVMGLVAFAFIVVFREGFETVLFLTPFASSDPGGTIVGAALGIVTSLVIAYFIFRVGVRINLRRFFYLSSLLLVLLAGGLAGYGVHELIEYKEAVGAETGWFGATAFDLGIASDSPLHHKGTVGSVFAVMFGYSTKMEWGRVIVHLAYLAIFIPMTVLAYRRPDVLRRIVMRVCEGLRAVIPGLRTPCGEALGDGGRQGGGP